MSESYVEREERERLEWIEAQIEEKRAKAKAQTIVDKVAPLVRAAIAKLDPPWFVCTSGLEIVPPQPGDPFMPYFVCLERLNGLEHKVIAVPQASSESEARTMAEAQCRAERAAYRAEARRLAEEVLREHDAWEAHNYLRNLRLAEEQAREERRRANEPPVVRVLGRLPLEPAPVSFSDEGKAAAAARRSATAAQRSGDFVRILPKPTAKPEKRVINVEAPDEAELAARRLAAQNKF